MFKKYSPWMLVFTVVILATGSAIAMSKTDKNAEPQSAKTESSENSSSDSGMAAAQLDIVKAMEIRALGTPDAPVKITEYASLTCPHCAHFHEDTLKQFKEKYIDTGKVYFVFSEFPLNGPALDATAISRCLPKESYYRFTSYLFEKQKDWAFGGGHRDWLKKNARLLGMGEQMFNECISSVALRSQIAKKMEESQKHFKISSTPTFVIDDEEVITGALPFEAFAKAIDERLKNADAAAPTEEETEDTGTKQDTE